MNIRAFVAQKSHECTNFFEYQNVLSAKHEILRTY